MRPAPPALVRLLKTHDINVVRVWREKSKTGSSTRFRTEALRTLPCHVQPLNSWEEDENGINNRVIIYKIRFQVDPKITPRTWLQWIDPETKEEKLLRTKSLPVNPHGLNWVYNVFAYEEMVDKENTELVEV